MRLRLTDAAENDLGAIWAHVSAERSETIATRLIEKIKSACLPLLSFPKLGPAREGLAPGLRVTFEGRYAIYYAHDDREVIVVRVLHGSRDIAAIAATGGFT